MLKRTLLLLAGLGLALASPAWAVLPGTSHAYEVPVSPDMAAPIYQQLTPAEASRDLPGWDAFVAGRGQGWFVAQYRQELGTPSGIIGPGIKLVDPQADVATIRDAAARFVTQAASVLKCESGRLGTPEVIDLGQDREVIFGQTYQGMEVIGGRVDLFLENGFVVEAGSEYYPGIGVGTVPALSVEQAREAAVRSMPFNPVTDRFEATPRLVVYPMILQSAPTYFLAYEVRFHTEKPVGDWWAYVDASDGQILTRTNAADDFDIPTTVSSEVNPNIAQDPYANIASEFEWVSVNSGNYYTDKNGYVDLPVPQNQSYPVTSQLRGSYTNVNRSDGGDASWSGTGTAGTPLPIQWDDSNSETQERDAYYSINRVHDWLKAVDPTFTGMDYVVPCNINISSGTCNAYWDGSATNFYADGGGCENMALMSDVVMHEYGHGITQYTYSPQQPPTSSGMGEGLSDCVAMTITNDRYMGQGIHHGTGFVRDGMNDEQYPGSDCGGEVHCLGQMIMGSMWKTRLGMTADLGYDAGKAKYDQIFRAAWKTKQTTMPNFLLKLLAADDNNNDLGDGTPDWYDICDAWGSHNIPCPALTKYIKFTHTPLTDQTSSTSPYEVISLIQAVNSGTLVADSLRVYYSIDHGNTWLNVLMTATGNPNEYHGYIPAQPSGKVITYYLRARTSTGVIGTDPLEAPKKASFIFMVGSAVTVLQDDFEQDRGWTFGAPGDNATDGIWERVDPQGKVDPDNGEVVQPEDDHTADPGHVCLVTDGRDGYFTNYAVNGGRTTALSPIYDFTSSTGAAKVDFWGFFANEFVINDSLTCGISNDGGNTWTNIVNIFGPVGTLNAWNEYVGYITNDVVPFTNNMRFRFQCANYDGSLTEAAVDDAIFSVTGSSIVGVGPSAPAPVAFAVEPNQPNPVRSTTTIRYSVPAAGPVSIEIFDAAGRMIRNLSPGQVSAGLHTTAWNVLDDAGRPAPSGVYYYRVRANGQESTRNLIVIR